MQKYDTVVFPPFIFQIHGNTRFKKKNENGS